MNEYVYNTLDSAATVLLKRLHVTDALADCNCVIVGNSHEISYHIAGTLGCLLAKYPEMQIHIVEDHTEKWKGIKKDICEQWSEIKLWDSLDAYLNREDEDRKEYFMDLVNLRAEVYSGADKEARAAAYREEEGTLRRLLEYNRSRKDNLLQLITCIPALTEPLPEGINAIAEREYEVIFRDYEEDSPQKFVVHMENLLREEREQTDRIQVIRLDRVFGPGIYRDDSLGIYSILEGIRKENKVILYDKDRFDYFSAAFVRDASLGILLALLNGRKGNIYHVSTWELTRFQVIYNLMEIYSDRQIQLEVEHDGSGCEKRYRMLNARKMRLTHFRKLGNYIITRKRWALKSTGDWIFGEGSYVPENDITVYYGRMNRIRELELQILLEVDRICRENQITYFLSAGTMLGAVRHQGFIPWDDDVDIGMLPEDYMRFLKVCPESLDVEFGYQNVSTESTSHYIHDKIRLKNSFFSTKYSDKYQMLNGLYIDVFVYYRTANTEFFQKKHIREIHELRKLIGIRWAIRKKKGIRYRISYNITHLFPASWFDKWYRHVLMKYNWRKTKYRVDGGFNLERVGALPDEWFHGTVDATFCGHTFPILQNYDSYLRHWYGDEYMKLLPPGKRQSVHDVVRIDLGQNLFDETRKDKRFRDVDLRGELYETAKVRDV